MEAALKQVNAPFGEFGLDTLNADTDAITTNPSVSANETFYQDMDSQLQACEAARQSLVAQIHSALTNAEQGVAPIGHGQANVLTFQAQALINEAQSLGTYTAATLPATHVCS